VRTWGKPGSEGAHFPAWWKLTAHFQTGTVYAESGQTRESNYKFP